MVVNRGFKYRLYPEQAQVVQFLKTIGCKRFVYNKMLNDKIEYYNETKSQFKVNPASYKDKFPFLKEVDSLALTSAWSDLNNAYNKFFKEPKIGFPKFKSKKYSRKSYTTHNQPKSQAIRLNEDKTMIKLPKTGWVKLKYHRSLPEDYEIKTVTISQEPSGKWYVSINVEYKKRYPNLNLDENNSIGLDYSSHDFYIDNQGERANYPKFYRLLEKRLVREQRKLSNMKYQSNNWYKQKRKVDIVHEKIRNSRLDFCHKLSYELANKYDYVFVEDINLQNLSQCLKLGKSTNDNGFGMFRSFLQYKLEDRGKQLIKIDKWYPSSKTCSVCGSVNKDLELKDREWICPNCGTRHDRDINAGANIRNEGIRLVKQNRRDYGDSSLTLNSVGVFEREAPKL